MFDEKTNLCEGGVILDEDLVIEEAEEVIAPGILMGD
jgi:hypothetical protein